VTPRQAYALAHVVTDPHDVLNDAYRRTRPIRGLIVMTILAIDR
jgi:hypothetical protein